MLDRLLESPMAALGFIFFVIVLAGVYLVNRERAQVQRMRGPRRFQPKWRDHGGGRKKSRRRRRRTGGFQPVWTERDSGEKDESEEGAGEPGEGPGPPSGG